MRRGDRIPALKDTLKRVAKIATFLAPSGISLRFLNPRRDHYGGFDKLGNDFSMDIFDQIDFRGPTFLGNVLQEKIIAPMIIEKEKKGSFDRPLMTIIITDGEVSSDQVNIARFLLPTLTQ